MSVSLFAATEADRDTFRALFNEVARGDLRLLPEPVLGPLLDVQWRAFNASLASLAGEVRDFVIRCDADRVGRVVLATDATETTIVEFAVLEAVRGRGIGTRVLELLQASAERESQTLVGHVKRGSAALHLYERLGFVKQQCSPDAPHIPMRWEALP